MVRYTRHLESVAAYDLECNWLMLLPLRHRCSYGNSSMANVRRLKDLSAPLRQDLLDKRLDMECIWMHLTIERLSK